MDKRFIFRYRSWTTKSSPGAGWGRPSVALELLRLSSQAPNGQTPGSPGGRPVGAEEWETRRATFGDSVEPRLQEKPGGGCRERPYRKPTLVAGCESTKVDE